MNDFTAHGYCWPCSAVHTLCGQHSVCCGEHSVCRTLTRKRLLDRIIRSFTSRRWGERRDKPDCHFRKTANEYDSKPGMKWLSCTAK